VSTEAFLECIVKMEKRNNKLLRWRKKGGGKLLTGSHHGLVSQWKEAFLEYIVVKKEK